MFSSAVSPVVLLSANILTAIGNTDPFGWLCLVVLFLLSIYSVSIIFNKFYSIKRARYHSKRFSTLADSEGSWESLFVAAKKFHASPLATLFRETYTECRLEKWFESNNQLTTEGKLSVARETIESVLNRVLADEESRMQRQLYLLSMMASLSPFIGLLGTVWGILVAFQSIGEGGSAALGALAPGISTALITTIFGLIAAIPALVAHHYFSSEVETLCQEMEGFSQDLDNAVRKQLLAGRGAPK